MDTSIYDAMRHADLIVGHHESDLYVRDTRLARKLLEELRARGVTFMIIPFVSETGEGPLTLPTGPPRVLLGITRDLRSQTCEAVELDRVWNWFSSVHLSIRTTVLCPIANAAVTSR